MEDERRSFVPNWDGNPGGWKRYRDEVRVWLLSERKDVSYSLAARLVQRLSGAARRAALALTDEQLSADPEVLEAHDTDGAITQPYIPADATAGVH